MKSYEGINPNCRCPLCLKTPKEKPPAPAHAAKALLESGVDGDALDAAVKAFRKMRSGPSSDHADLSEAVRVYLEACAG